MVKIIYFNIAAVVLLAVILISSTIRKTTKGKANVSFLIAVLEVFFTAVFDTMAIYYDNLGVGFVEQKWFFHFCYLFFHTFTATFYLIYLISLTDTWHKLKHNKLLSIILCAPIVLFAVLMIINFFNPIIFSINDSDIYTRGSAFIFNYLVAGFYLAFGVYYVFKYRHLFTTKWILTLFSPYPLILLAMVIQFFAPTIVIEMFVNALALLFVYNSIQRPEELYDVMSGFLNGNAYEKALRKDYLNKKTECQILAKIANYKTISDISSFDDRIKYVKIISAGIRRIFKSLKLYVEIYYPNAGEFCIIINERHMDKAPECAQKIREVLKQTQKINNVTISPLVDVCVINIPEDIPDFDLLVSFNLNFKDRNHQNEVLLANELFKEDYYRILLNIDRIIEKGLSKHNLEVYYQPIYSVRKQCFTCAEALLRLRDEQYGFVPPDIFIPASEKSGAIYRISEFVFGQVCQFMASEDYKSLNLDYLEINLSPIECMQDNLAERICEVAKAHNLDTNSINLEVTETAITQLPKQLLDNMLKLSKAGFSISLDDFGSGYSNMHRIASIPVDIVKLDKVFFENIETKKMSIILESVISMLKLLGLKIVAEGIETKEVADKLIALDCDYIQGFYYARPMPKSNFMEFIKKQNK